MKGKKVQRPLEHRNKPDDVDQQENNTKRRNRVLPIAVVARRGESSFPELLKILRAGIDPSATDEKISKMREARNGGLLVEINGGAESAEVVRSAIEKSLGPCGSVRTLEQRSLIELRDLDGITTNEDIVDSFARDYGTRAEEVKVLNIRTTYGGSQAATLLVPREVASRLLTKGRIRVGLIYVRAREGKSLSRCFRCFDTGHVARDCRGVDRSKECRRCGKEGHFVKSCEASQEEATAFRRVIGAYGSKVSGEGQPITLSC